MKQTIKTKITIDVEYDAEIDFPEEITDKATKALELDLKGAFTAMFIDDVILAHKEDTLVWHEKKIEVSAKKIK